MRHKTITLEAFVANLETRGEGCNLISDDAGRWAVSTSGHQPVVTGEHKATFETRSWVEPEEWRPTIREALFAFWKLSQEPSKSELKRLGAQTGKKR